MKFEIDKRGPGLARAGKIVTAHGVIETPAFIVVGTKATVKALTPEQVSAVGAQAVLANTYHLYLQPGPELVARAGGVGKFMNWSGPTFTDSGGFQVFSLGAAFGQKVSKLAPPSLKVREGGGGVGYEEERSPLARIDDDGVTFRSHLDGSEHRFTPERSMQIQHALGADIIFAFDECTSPTASHDYQREAMDRTHAWAARSLAEHKKLGGGQALFGIVQGGRFQDLREESARIISQMELARTDGSRGGFDGFGVGGSFEKKDLDTAVGWVNRILPEEKPRHLLGIGEPEDLIAGVLNGVDTFDCVTPTRNARNGTLQTKHGKINILNAQFREDLAPIEEGCGCYTCERYTRAYLAHLFRAKEMLAATLASIHNLYFSVNLVKQLRQAILDGRLSDLLHSKHRVFGFRDVV
jgi:queuine tRNA-ribosyltransferase